MDGICIADEVTIVGGAGAGAAGAAEDEGSLRQRSLGASDPAIRSSELALIASRQFWFASGRLGIRLFQSHFDRDAYQVGMVLCAELLLQQRGGVGDGLVGDIKRIGDFGDLVAAAE